MIAPDHRCVARQLATEWEDQRMAPRRLHEESARLVQTHPRSLSAAAREALVPLAHHVPALWHAPTTTMAERTERVRQSIQRVIVAGAGRRERRQSTMAWIGGGSTTGGSTRPLSRSEPLRDDPRLCERRRALAQAGSSTVQMTAGLAQEGCHAPKQATPCSRPSVVEVRRRLGVHPPRRRRRPPLRDHAWWLSDLERG